MSMASSPSTLAGRMGRVLQSSHIPSCSTPSTCFFNRHFGLWPTWAFIPNKEAKNIPSVEAFYFPCQEGGVRAGCRSQTCPGTANRQQPLAAGEQDPALAWHMLPHRLWYHHPKLEQGIHQQGHVLSEKWGRAAAPPSPASFLPVGAAELELDTGTIAQEQTWGVCLISAKPIRAELLRMARPMLQ